MLCLKPLVEKVMRAIEWPTVEVVKRARRARERKANNEMSNKVWNARMISGTAGYLPIRTCL